MKAWWSIWVLVGIVLIGGVYLAHIPPAPITLASLRFPACTRAKAAVLKRLKAPATADFPSCGSSLDEYQITATDDLSEITVSSYVDAQNIFGAKHRNNFIVVLLKSNRYDAYSGWAVKSVFLEPTN